MHFFHEKLAIEIGINEAIFLQNLYYLCKKNLLKEKIDKNFNISVTMSRASILEYQEYFSYTTIRRITKNLINFNLIEVNQLHKSVTNSLSYSLTPKAWMIMFALEKTGERKKIDSASAKFNNVFLLNFTEQLLKKSKGVLNITDLLSNPQEDLLRLADIIIEYRNLIEHNITIEERESNDIENFQKYFYEIEENISQNLILKKRIEKTFENINNYMIHIIVPAIKKFGILKVIEAVKNTVSEFLPTHSPVFYFYANLEKLTIQQNNY